MKEDDRIDYQLTMDIRKAKANQLLIADKMKVWVPEK